MEKPTLNSNAERQVQWLRALNEAAISLQRASHSEEAILTTFREQLAKLGLWGSISTFDETGEHLEFQAIAVSQAGGLQGVLKSLERIVGIKAEGYAIPVSSVAVYQQVLAGRKTIFIPDSSEIVVQLLPRPARKITAQAVKAFGGQPGIYVPLLWEGHTEGVVSIVGPGLTSDDIPAMEVLVNHIAIALENAQLFKAEREQRRISEVLEKVGLALNAVLDLQDLLALICRESINLFQVDAAYIWLAEGDELVGFSGYGAGWENFVGIRVGLADTTILGPRVIAERQPIYVNEATSSRDVKRELIQLFQVKSILGIPLIKADKGVGALMIIDTQSARRFGPKDIEIGLVLGSHAAVAVENARLFNETRDRAEELEALMEVSAALRQAQNLDEMRPIIVSATVDAMRAQAGAFFVSDERDDTLQATALYGFSSETEILRSTTVAALVSRCLNTSDIVFTDDIASDTSGTEALSEFHKTLGAPVRTAVGVVGVLLISYAMKGEPTAFEKTLLATITEMTGNALQRAGVMDTLEQHVAARTQELEKANERLEELDRLKSKFIADVSHELRTPITNMNIYLDLLARGSPEKREENWDVLKEQARRLAELVEEILSLSRLERDRSTAVFAPIQLSLIAEQAVTALEKRAEAANIELVADIVPDLPLVTAERSLLYRAVLNLLANAIQYTPAGGVVSVETAMAERPQNMKAEAGERKDEQGAQVTISDTGMGIEAEDLPHIFERFYRGDRAGQSDIPGTGLGLAIVKEIVQLHNGDVRVESRIGEGSAFHIWLPLEPEEN